MCLVLLAWSVRPDYKLIMAANRDEFYQRKTAPLGYWQDQPILGGRDLECRGTWLGVTPQKRLAAVTNYREPLPNNEQLLSRGALVTDFLIDSGSPESFLNRLLPKARQYGGFNLIAGDPDQLFHCSNREHVVRKLTPGIYGISNHLLNTPWTKVVKGKELLSAQLEHNIIDPESLFEMLRNTSRPPDSQLPDTGVGLEWERLLSSMFITSPIYGTRSSSIILINAQHHITFYERTYKPITGEIKETLMFRC